MDILRLNTTITNINLYHNDIDNDIEEEIDVRTEWNRVGELSIDKITDLTSTCKYRLLTLILILNTLPICEDMHWVIMGMLKVKDIVDNGNPHDKTTWACYN